MVISRATALGVLLALGPGCAPKPQPTRLPPKEVPHIQNVSDDTGARSNILDDAVQVGSNQARLVYDCGPPYGRNVEGKGVLTASVTRCEADTTTQTVTLRAEQGEECPSFLLVMNPYRGPGTYNTSNLSQLSFGLAKLRQPACKWEGNLCLEWNRQGQVHPEATCTVEVSSDGGLQYGTSGATISGTFVCSAFLSPFRGCAGVQATAGCGVVRGSFSVAGCTTVSSTSQAPEQTPASSAKGKGRRGR